jgi:hypothetical protein
VTAVAVDGVAGYVGVGVEYSAVASTAASSDVGKRKSEI